MPPSPPTGASTTSCSTRRARSSAAADLDRRRAAGERVSDESSDPARFRGQPLDLTFKEFELLKYLAQHPGRVFTRAQLLQEVWGYDYFGGTRTVDVHVRRLRAKLGPEHESLIGTVRNVGYRFVTPEKGDRVGDEAKAAADRAKPEDADESAALEDVEA